MDIIVIVKSTFVISYRKKVQSEDKKNRERRTKKGQKEKREIKAVIEIIFMSQGIWGQLRERVSFLGKYDQNN